MATTRVNSIANIMIMESKKIPRRYAFTSNFDRGQEIQLLFIFSRSKKYKFSYLNMINWCLRTIIKLTLNNYIGYLFLNERQIRKGQSPSGNGYVTCKHWPITFIHTDWNTIFSINIIDDESSLQLISRCRKNAEWRIKLFAWPN